MWPFQDEHELVVASSVYNLAGEDATTRPNFLKNVILQAILGNTDSIAETLLNSYLSGPGITFLRFLNWADVSGYTDIIGESTSTLSTKVDIDLADIKTILDNQFNTNTLIEDAVIGYADIYYWAKQWVANTFPNLLGTNYTVDSNSWNSSNFSITITFEDSSSYTFIPADFDPNKQYLYVTYSAYTELYQYPIVLGSLIVSDLPDTSLYTLQDSNPTTHSEILTTTTITTTSYSDGTPSSTTTNTTTSVVDVISNIEVFTKSEITSTPVGKTGVYYTTYTLTNYTDYNILPITTTTTNSVIVGGVTATTTITKVEDTIVFVYSYKQDTQDFIESALSDSKVFIYKQNSGNTALDVYFSGSSSEGTFLPFVPIRLNNRFISDIDTSLYTKCKQAVKKATGGKLDDIINSLKDNASLSDIDYAYILFGVPLNTKSDASKQYIFSFFDSLSSSTTYSSYANWKITFNAARQYILAMQNWYNSPNYANGVLKPKPVYVGYPTLPWESIKITSTKSVMNLDISIGWNYLIKEVLPALPNKSQGNCWLELGSTETFQYLGFQMQRDSRVVVPGKKVELSSITICYQHTDSSYTKITIVGLHHQNNIYGGKSVSISGKTALEDSEESGFILPIHSTIFKNTLLLPRTQLATECAYLLVNCYDNVRIPWYATDTFKVFLIVLTITLAVFAGPAAGGLLGTNAEVGTAILAAGATATEVLIVGAIANSIAAILISDIIQKAAVATFGEKDGAIIGTIASMLIIWSLTPTPPNDLGLKTTVSLANASNILLLGNAVLGGYAQYLGAEAKSVYEEQAAYTEENKEALTAIEEKSSSLFGSQIDIAELSKTILQSIESPSEFLVRTQMTGTDVVELSHDLVYNFTELSTSLRLP